TESNEDCPVDVKNCRLLAKLSDSLVNCDCTDRRAECKVEPVHKKVVASANIVTLRGPKGSLGDV
ncbi:hypothetical protein HHI36_014050, partial [Cryptolaemus montrouzieri]